MVKTLSALCSWHPACFNSSSTSNDCGVSSCRHDALRAAGGLSATGPNPAVVEALSKEYPKAELVQQLGAYAAQARRALGDTMLQVNHAS